MRIASIDLYPLAYSLDRPLGDAQGPVSRRPTVAIKLSTDEGAYGWSEMGGGGWAETALLRQVFESALQGENPLETERLWHKMARPTARYPRLRGPLDNALWDLKARILGIPLVQALGGAQRDRVPAYASLHNYYPDREDLTKDILSLVEDAKALRFCALKLKIGGRAPDEDINYISAVRDALGPERRLMVDANQAYDMGTAVYVGRVLEDEDITWFEEPLPRPDMAGYFLLRQKLDVPIAGGEGLDGLASFMPFVEHRAVDIIQPDLAGAGGITSLRHIAAVAAASNIRFTLHCWNVSIQLVASLHFLASLPPWRLPSIFTEAPPLEVTTVSDDLRESLLATPMELDEAGAVRLPTGPGLGVEVNPDALKRFAVPQS